MDETVRTPGSPLGSRLQRSSAGSSRFRPSLPADAIMVTLRRSAYSTARETALMTVRCASSVRQNLVVPPESALSTE